MFASSGSRSQTRNRPQKASWTTSSADWRSPSMMNAILVMPRAWLRYSAVTAWAAALSSARPVSSCGHGAAAPMVRADGAPVKSERCATSPSTYLRTLWHARGCLQAAFNHRGDQRVDQLAGDTAPGEGRERGQRHVADDRQQFLAAKDAAGPAVRAGAQGVTQ